ncbi:restriction endonuclease subunit S [Thiofilum flexile]|uniref:restriction endonuclease subunit S n=1 Tax=Thiofilum flexile TaxID=125627 RepID=UPI00035F945B|nr:restriction endonuclease subunit S [Thiofilum flexile]
MIRVGKLLQNNWPWVQANDVIDVRDGTHESPKYQENGIPLVTSKNLVGGILDFSSCSYISEDDHLAISKRSFVDDGDILFAMIGTIGNPVIVKKDFEFSIKNVALFKFSKSKVLNRFFLYFLESGLAKQQLLKNSRGGTQKFVSLKNIRQLQIPLPPLPEQKRIAAILDAADTLRSKRRQSIAELDALLQATFLEMFGDPVENPKGWEIISANDVFTELTYGTSVKSFNDKRNNSTPVLRIPNVAEGKIDWSDIKFVSLNEKEIKKLRLKKNDLLFVRTNGNPDYIGRCALFDSDCEAIFASYLIRGRINKTSKLDANFIKHLIEYPTYRHEVRREARTTAGNYNLSTKGIKNFRFITPSWDLQKQFARIVESIEAQKALQQKHLDELDHLFSSLQQRAFNGEL